MIFRVPTVHFMSICAHLVPALVFAICRTQTFCVCYRLNDRLFVVFAAPAVVVLGAFAARP